MRLQWTKAPEWTRRLWNTVSFSSTLDARRRQNPIPHERARQSRVGTEHSRRAHSCLSLGFSEEKPSSGRGIGRCCLGVPRSVDQLHEKSHLGCVAAAGG